MNPSTAGDGAARPPFSDEWRPPEIEPVSRFFEADDGARLHYHEWPADPDAAVVTMIHGRCGHTYWFEPVVPFFHPRYQCAALDLRGHGDSDGFAGKSSLERYSADIAQFVNLYRGRRVILFAHSYGGALAVLAVQHHGARPDLFVIADTIIHWNPMKEHPNRMAAGTAEQKKRYPSAEAALERFRLIPDGTLASDELLAYMGRRSMRRNDDGTWSWKFQPAAAVFPEDNRLLEPKKVGLEGIACPTLVVHGERSAAGTTGEATRIANRIPDAEVAMIPRAYHHIMLDRPGAMSQALLDFFEARGF